MGGSANSEILRKGPVPVWHGAQLVNAYSS